jgi:hypothetical protein
MSTTIFILYASVITLAPTTSQEPRVQGGPDMNKISFHAKPHRNMHSTLKIDYLRKRKIHHRKTIKHPYYLILKERDQATLFTTKKPY